MGLACLTIKWPKSTASMPKVKPEFRVLMNPVLIIFAFAEFFVFLGLFTPFFYISPYSVHIGLDSSISFYMISIINAASLFGRLLSGLVADRFGFFNVLALCVLLSAVICMCLTTATSLGGVIVLSLAYGLTSGVSSKCLISFGITNRDPRLSSVYKMPVRLPLWNHIKLAWLLGPWWDFYQLRTFRGSTFKSKYTNYIVRGLIGTPIVGQILLRYNYLGVALFSGLAMLIGFVLLSVARFKKDSRIFAKAWGIESL